MLDRIATTQYRQVDSGGSAFVLLHKYTYAYDDQSRFESIDSTEDGLSEFSYDQIGQLTDADHAVSRPDEMYAFDETGNRTGGTTIDDGNLLVDDGTFDYVYDKNGNRIEKSNSSTGETWEYDWDHRNRLIEVTYDSTGSLTVTTTLDYDVFNRLVHVEESDPNTSTTRDKFFAGFDEYDDATLTFDGDTAGDLLDRILTHRGEVFAQENRLLNGTADSNVLWGLNDHLGTARDIARYLSTSSLFEVVDNRVYDSFGNLTSGGTATDFAFGFTGQLVDVGADVDLNYHHNRWYDASTGRWISNDPIGFAAGDVNLQRYVGNDTIKFVDSNGLLAATTRAEEDAGQGQTANPAMPPGNESWVWPWDKNADWSLSSTATLWGNKSIYYGSAVGRGLGTSTKAATNTVVSTATIGFVDEAWEVNENDLGYSGSRIGFELATLAIPGSAGGKFGKGIDKTLDVIHGLDKAQSVTLVARGTHGALTDIAADGSFDWRNGVMIGSGAIGIGGTGRIADDVGDVIPSAPNRGITAQNGTRITGYTRHGVDRAAGNGFDRAGTSPEAILDALRNPTNVKSGVDNLGRPFEVFTGRNGRVVVNPDTGKIISVNPLGGGGVRGR